MPAIGVRGAPVQELFSCDATAGIVYWRKRHWCGRYWSEPGDRAGAAHTAGYRAISGVLEHRIIWELVTGEKPVGEIDHINGDRSDNRICNLRVVTREGNAQNTRRPRKDNTSGYLGVHWLTRERKWKAEIVFSGRKKGLGYFDTPEEAHEAYLRAKRELHTTCTI